MKYRYLVYLVLTVIVLSVAVLPVSAQKRIGVVKLDVSRTVVYRGYQWVEVVAYIYTGDTPARPTLTRATATLTAGLTLSMPLTLVELISPTTIKVDGVEYIVQFLALVRVPVPEAMFTGKGTLRIDIAGRAAGVDFTLVRDIALEIADHRPVLLARTEVMIALERVRAVVTLASALGVDISGYMKELSVIEGTIAGASERLDLYGEVDEALSLYKEALASLSSLEGRIISTLAIRYGTIESRISLLEGSLTQTIRSVEDLSKTLATTIAQLEKGLEDVSKRSMDAVSALARHMEDYSKKIDESLSTLARSVDSVLKSMAEANRKATEAALNDLAGRIGTLDKNVAELAKSQRELASRISDISNTMQIALIVVAVMLLASIAVMKFIR